MRSLWSFLSPGWNSPVISGSFHWRAAPTLWLCLWCSPKLALTGPWLSCAGAPRAGAEWRGRILSLTCCPPCFGCSQDGLSLWDSRHTLKHRWMWCRKKAFSIQYYFLYRNIKWIWVGLLKENLSTAQALIWQSQEFCFFIIMKKGQTNCGFFLPVRKLHFYGLKLLSCWNHTQLQISLRETARGLAFEGMCVYASLHGFSFFFFSK